MFIRSTSTVIRILISLAILSGLLWLVLAGQAAALPSDAATGGSRAPRSSTGTLSPLFRSERSGSIAAESPLTT
jgi:hypothetical protein